MPSFASQPIRSRLLRSGDTEADALVFNARVRTPHTTNNIRRLLCDVMDAAGIENVTPHRSAGLLRPSSTTRKASYSPLSSLDTRIRG